MFPPPGADALKGRRSRHSSFTDNDLTPLAGPRQTPQMTYFLADEKTMEASLARSSASTSRIRPPTRPNYGVESLEATISSLASDGSHDTEDLDTSVGQARETWRTSLGKVRPRQNSESASTSRSPSPKSSIMSRDLSPLDTRTKRLALDDVSRPLTPACLESPLLASIPGSPISRRGSESEFMTDDGASQAILSDGEDAEETPMSDTHTASTSQLVMPSLSLPRRRPFTEKGKTLGRLKIMIAGDSGTGKTALIKAIFQLCEDIVHVDELSTASLAASETSLKKSTSKVRSPASTSRISEVYASTRAYPPWWSEMDDGKVLRRRKSMGDSVLERNLCFVDTPGYSNGTSFLESIGPTVQYLESHLDRAAQMQLTDSELISMMGGNGGTQVDVVFYLIHQRLKPTDLEYLRRLVPLTNVIPVISKSDTCSPEQLRSIKANVLSQLAEAQIKPFLFGASSYTALEPGSQSPPYIISTLPGSDPETMDASLLMSPDYVSPLVPSQLSELVAKVFDRDSISWLRHSTAKKFIQHRGRSRTQSLPQSVAFQPKTSILSTSLFSLPSSSSQIVTPPLGATNSYSLARITDHTQREERLAQIRLSKWASDLQQSLHNERRRFEALARGERAIWLTERLNEVVQDGTLVPASEARRSQSPLTAHSGHSGILTTQSGKNSHNKKGKCGGRPRNGMDRTDPLGLVKLNEEMQRKTWAALQIVSGFGILGGLAWWWSKGGWVAGTGSSNEFGSMEGQNWSLMQEWGRLVGDW